MSRRSISSYSSLHLGSSQMFDAVCGLLSRSRATHFAANPCATLNKWLYRKTDYDAVYDRTWVKKHVG
jgi:hypothetical protein